MRWGVKLNPKLCLALAKHIQQGENQLPIDFVEVAPEAFLKASDKICRALADVASVFPVSLHSISMSLGGNDPLNWGFLARVKDLAKSLNTIRISDHIAIASLNGVFFNDLISLPPIREAGRHVAQRARQVAEFFADVAPFALENPSTYLEFAAPQREFSDAEFIQSIIEGSGCDFLLDINNLTVSGFNGGATESADLEAYCHSFFSAIDPDCVSEVHLAGYEEKGPGLRIDTHGNPLQADTLKVTRQWLKKHAPPKAFDMVWERESGIVSLEKNLEEVASLKRELRPGAAIDLARTLGHCSSAL